MHFPIDQSCLHHDLCQCIFVSRPRPVGWRMIVTLTGLLSFTCGNCSGQSDCLSGRQKFICLSMATLNSNEICHEEFVVLLNANSSGDSVHIITRLHHTMHYCVLLSERQSTSDDIMTRSANRPMVRNIIAMESYVCILLNRSLKTSAVAISKSRWKNLICQGPCKKCHHIEHVESDHKADKQTF